MMNHKLKVKVMVDDKVVVYRGNKPDFKSTYNWFIKTLLKVSDEYNDIKTPILSVDGNEFILNKESDLK